MPRILTRLSCALALALAACGGKASPAVDGPASIDGPAAIDARLECVPGPVPAELGLDAFYQKHCNVSGIPIVSSSRVPDAAFHAATDVVQHMLAGRADVRAALVSAGARVAIMAESEVTTDIPEHAFLADDPKTDWDARARGLGGTPSLPLTSCAEENLLCYAGDRYRGENILVHELAHTLHRVGLDAVDASFSSDLAAAYQAALAAGLWQGTYAASDAFEYFAEGVQSYLDANLSASPPDGIHNDVDTRAELLAYDPSLHALVARVIPETAWRPRCP